MVSNPFSELELHDGSYYFLCSAGIGDTMLICGFYEALVKKWGAPIHLLIKPSHEFLMEMYQNDNYTVVRLDGVDLQAVSDSCKVPKKGCIYVAHPHAHTELIHFFMPVRDQFSTIRFIPWFRQFLGLSPDEPLQLPERTIDLSPKTKARVEQFAPLEKIVLLSPEATSSLGAPDVFWNELAQEIRDEGYVPISNVMRPERCVAGSCFLNLSAHEAVEIAFHCHAVYSLRSGLCDPLYMLGDRLHVFYPTYNSIYLYSLNEMFSRTDIDEQILLEIALP